VKVVGCGGAMAAGRWLDQIGSGGHWSRTVFFFYFLVVVVVVTGPCCLDFVCK
jgi:hypothetical protein